MGWSGDMSRRVAAKLLCGLLMLQTVLSHGGRMQMNLYETNLGYTDTRDSSTLNPLPESQPEQNYQQHSHGVPGHECIHDRIQDRIRELNKDVPEYEHHIPLSSLETGGGRNLQQADATESAAPLRIVPIYQLGNLPEGKVSVLKKDVMPKAIAALERAFKIRKPVQTALVLPRTCEFVVKFTNLCSSYAPTETCSGFLPEGQPDAHFGETRRCSSSNPSSCVITEGGSGVDAADIIIYVTASQTPDCEGSALAYASACQKDRDGRYGLKNRPLSGFINLCPSRISTAVNDYSQLLDTAVHEITHTLFMSNTHFGEFIDDDGEVLSTQQVVENGRIVTPNVKRVVGEHFGCKSGIGAPLEDNGVGSTRGSHWEATTFQGELMIGVSGSRRAIVSEATLALAEDSGWYRASWDSAGFLRYGHKTGCSLLEGACANLAPTDLAAEYFCSPQSDGNIKTRCVDDQEATCFAGSELTGTCTPATPLPTGDCTVPENMAKKFSSPIQGSNLGVFYGPTSICLPIPSEELFRGGILYPVQSACWATSCSDDGTSLTILIPELKGNAFIEYPCPPGGFLEPDSAAGFGSGFKLGPCPKAEDVCPYNNCVVTQEGKLCSGMGNCYNSKCYCHVGSSGYDCSETLCETSADCEPEQICNSKKECVFDGVAPPPPPPAQPYEPSLEQLSNYNEVVPMRAVHTGYLRRCAVYEDSNDDNIRSSSDIGAITGQFGEVGLSYGGGPAETLFPIKQGVATTACIDTLTSSGDLYTKIRATSGVPSEGSTLSVFTTIVYLRYGGSGTSSGPDYDGVAKNLGLETADMIGADWIETLIKVDGDGSPKIDSARKTMLVALQVVNSAEQIGAFLGTTNLDRMTAVNAFLHQLGGESKAETDLTTAAAMARIITTTAKNLTANAKPASVDALAGTVALVNARLRDSKQPIGQNVVEDWAKISVVAQKHFRGLAADLGDDKIQPAAYTQQTTLSELDSRAKDVKIDLEDGTTLKGQGFVQSGLTNVKSFLKDEQLGGLKGWVWLVIGGIGLLVLLTILSALKAHRRKKEFLKQQEEALQGHMYRQHKIDAERQQQRDDVMPSIYSPSSHSYVPSTHNLGPSSHSYTPSTRNLGPSSRTLGPSAHSYQINEPQSNSSMNDPTVLPSQ